MLTAYIQTDSSSEIIEKEKFIGSFAKTNLFSVVVRFWNNRYGADNVNTITDATLIIEFPTAEEARLLEYMKVTVDNVYEKHITINDTKGYVLLNRDISGAKNVGTDNYTDNYVDIKIEITKDIPVQKVLKSMYLNIV